MFGLEPNNRLPLRDGYGAGAAKCLPCLATLVRLNGGGVLPLGATRSGTQDTESPARLSLRVSNYVRTVVGSPQLDA